jgi:O-antigen/teichoic acid export membrane protein
MAKLTQKIANIAFGDIIGRGFGFITSVYLARVLGAEAFGLITVALAFLSYAIWASDFGLSDIGVREIAKKADDQDFGVWQIFFLRLSMAILVFAAIQLVVPFLAIEENQKSLILRFSIALLPIAVVIHWYFNGQQRFGVIAWQKVIYGICYFALVMVFISGTTDLLHVPFLYLGAHTIGAIFLLSIAIPEMMKTRMRWETASLTRLLNAAFSVGIGSFFGQLMNFAPPILIGFFVGNYEAGLFGAAFKVIIIFMMIDRIFVNILLPNFTAQWVSNPTFAKKNLELTSAILLAFGGAVSLGIAVGAPFIIDVLFGEEYLPGAPVLTLLSIFLFFTLQNSLFAFGLIAMGQDRDYFKVMVAGGISAIFLMLVASMVGNLWLIGLAISIGELIVAVLAYLFFSRHLKLKYLKNFTTVLVIGGLSFSGALLVSAPILFKVALALLFYAICLFLFRVISTKHIVWVKEKLWA